MQAFRPKSHPNLWAFRDVSPADVQLIRRLPSRNWNTRMRGYWSVLRCLEVWDHMELAEITAGVEKPSDLRSAYLITHTIGEPFLIFTTLGTSDDVVKARRIPGPRQFDSQRNAWLVKPTSENVAYLRKNWPHAWWEGNAEHIADTAMLRGMAPQPEVIERANERKADIRAALDDEISDYKFRTQPYLHQLNAFKISRLQPAFALLMEMGTGKTWVAINTAGYQFTKGNITGLLVLCPNGMKEPWTEELAQHMPTDIPLDVFMWEARTRHKAEPWVRSVSPGTRKLRVLIMNIEAMSGSGAAVAQLFLSKHTSMMVVDESTRIKSPSAQRTKSVLKLGKLSTIRRILSGAPVTQGPLDLFSQFKFLDPNILGFSSMYAMRNRHAILGGWQGKQVIDYQYLDELTAKVDAYSFRVLKRDCLDLPEKVYEKRSVRLSDEQREAYDQMMESLKAEIKDMADGGRMKSSMVMHVVTRVMRCQQIVGGFLPVDDPDDPSSKAKTIPIPGENPKMTALLEIIDEQADDAKIIIWARFRAELALIEETLTAKYGAGTVGAFHGGVENLTRGENRRGFQDVTSKLRFFVGQPQAGGIGLTLTAASVMVYYSNDYSLETRLQSEDRFHRIGQEADKVTIVDLVAKNTSDSRILSALRSKKSLADLVQGDPSLSWL